MEFVSRFETTITTSTTKIVLFFSQYICKVNYYEDFFTWTCEEIFVPIPFSAA